MKATQTVLLMTGILIMLGVCTVNAQTGSPLQISIAPPVQLIPEEIDIRGLKLNLIYGVNEHVVGLDVGLASNCGEMEALQVNLSNRVQEELTGLQVGLLNTVGSGNGLQAGLLNHVGTVFAGVQIGLINLSEETTGMQLGLINRSEFLQGVQIGIVNVIEESPVPFFPIVNFGF